MKRFMVALFAVGLALVSSPQAWAGITVHDDIQIDYVRAGTGGQLGNSGNTVGYANGGGPFWASILPDGRPLTGGPLAQRDSGVKHWVNSTNRLGTHYDSVNKEYYGYTSPVVDTFFTYCVESSETFSPGTVYDVKDMDLESVNTNKVLTGYGAWVFEKFRDHVLVAGDWNPRAPTAATKPKMEAVQLALWAGMVGWTDQVGGTNGEFDINEPMGTVGGATSMYNVKFGANWDAAPSQAARLAQIAAAGLSYATFLADDANWAWDGASEYQMLRRWNGYQVINVQTDSGGIAQDQMLYLGGPTGLVPEPMSIVVWSVLAGGAAGVASIRRRRGRWSQESRQAIMGIIEGRVRQK